jgi:hypothetical protein
MYAAAHGDYNELEQLVAGQLAGLAPQPTHCCLQVATKHVIPARGTLFLAQH